MRACSSRRSSRSPIDGNGTPYQSASIWFHPAPSPSSQRPPLRWSTVTAAFARSPGGRKSTQKTRQPTRTRRVSHASAAIAATPSKEGLHGFVMSETDTRWSQTEHHS